VTVREVKAPKQKVWHPDLYIHTPLSSTQFFNYDLFAKNRKCNKDFIPDLLADEGPSTGW
jgi:hypothetical protein